MSFMADYLFLDPFCLQKYSKWTDPWLFRPLKSCLLRHIGYLCIQLYQSLAQFMNNNLFDTLASGAWIHAGAADVPEFGKALADCADACFHINQLPPSMADERRRHFRRLLGSVGETFVIHSPFRCDFGFNIHIGDNFIGNFNMSVLDEAPVTIGNNVFIGPNCCIATITHALLPSQRNEGIMSAHPVTIGHNVWIAVNVTILPGVTIGDGAVIGAGSVVTADIPAGYLAVGNPCRPLRPITPADTVIPIR